MNLATLNRGRELRGKKPLGWSLVKSRVIDHYSNVDLLGFDEFFSFAEREHRRNCRRGKGRLELMCMEG